jgi:hypothetical protein
MLDDVRRHISLDIFHFEMTGTISVGDSSSHCVHGRRSRNGIDFTGSNVANILSLSSATM